MEHRTYRGRLAPSPTGKLHLGTARSALAAWLAARSRGGKLLMRIEDLDPPRVIAGAAEAMLDDLRWLGLDWDDEPVWQSTRTDRYEAALESLNGAGLIFACSCSRKEVAAASSAPHGDLGPVYPGTCRQGGAGSGPTSRRFRMGEPEGFEDGIHGSWRGGIQDDFIVKRADGLFAYQLAVVVDDVDMGITEVVRGDDLLSSTPRQLALYRALGATPPRFVHVPLVFGPDGKRLAKRHGAVAIAEYRSAGWSPERLLGLLAHSLGWAPEGAETSAQDLVSRYDEASIPRQGWVAPEL